MSTEAISIRLTPGDLASLDELRPPGCSRSAFMRQLLRRAGPLDDLPDYPEALSLLTESARAGKVTAAIALERALRPDRGPHGPDGELARLLRGK